MHTKPTVEWITVRCENQLNPLHCGNFIKWVNFIWNRLSSQRIDHIKMKRFACRLIQSSIRQFYDLGQNGVNIEYWRQCSSVFENKPTEIILKKRETKNINKTFVSSLIIYDFILNRNFIYWSQSKKKIHLFSRRESSC